MTAANTNAISQYIPAGSEIVVRRNGVESWYTIVRNIELDTYATAPCPLRNAMPVLSAEVKGFRIWFLENQMCVRMPKEVETRVAAMSLVSLEYDIPTRVSTQPANYPDENGNSFRHPSQWMWAIGVRTTLSCWILPANKIPYRLLRSLTRAGCQYRVTKIDVTDAANHMQRAIIALRRELVQADERYEENMRAATARRDERGPGADSQKTYENDCKRNEKSRDTSIDNVEHGASALGIPMDWVRKDVDVTVGMSQTRVIQRNLTHTRVEAHCTTVDTLAATGHTAVAAAVESGEMPHAIAADYLDDNDIEVKVNGDGVYNLRDTFKDE